MSLLKFWWWSPEGFFHHGSQPVQLRFLLPVAPFALDFVPHSRSSGMLRVPATSQEARDKLFAALTRWEDMFFGMLHSSFFFNMALRPDNERWMHVVFFWVSKFMMLWCYDLPATSYLNLAPPVAGVSYTADISNNAWSIMSTSWLLERESVKKKPLLR